MKNIILIILIIILNYQAVAQLSDNFNLIPNGNFELRNNSDALINNCYGCKCWFNANKSIVNFFTDLGWGNPILTEPDTINITNVLSPLSIHYCLYFDTKLGGYDIKTNTFDSSISSVPYAQTKLITPLIKDKIYYLSFYLGGRKNENYLGDGFIPYIGFLFTKNRIHDTNNHNQILIEPQFTFEDFNVPCCDVNKFKKYIVAYIANGGEEYLTVGNFTAYANMTKQVVQKYLNPLIDTTLTVIFSNTIDNLSLVADTSIPTITPNGFNINNDIDTCISSQLTLVATKYFINYLWNTGATKESIAIKQNGKYWCTANLGCDIYSDTITVNYCDKELLNKILIPNAFTPNGDGINDYFLPSSNNVFHKIVIFNRFGEQLYNSSTNFSWDGYHQGYPCETGTYFYMIQYELKITNKVEIAKGEINLIR